MYPYHIILMSHIGMLIYTSSGLVTHLVAINITA